MVAPPRRFSVAQMGARMHYAVPRVLSRMGLLEHCFLDICANIGWTRSLSMIPSICRPASLRRLLGRVPKDVPRQQITAFAQFGLNYQLRLQCAHSPEAISRAHLWAGKTFGKLVSQESWYDTDVVYAFCDAALEILKTARQRGITSVLEQTIAPREIQRRLLDDEHDAFPGWERRCGDTTHIDEFVSRQHAEWSEADVVICASDFVRNAIRECNGPAERCRVVPYGIPSCPRKSRVAERPAGGHLRVLTVGSVGLRKGTPYVLQAAREMKRQAEFRMVGPITVSATAQDELQRHVNLIGQIPRAEIQAHYDWADVFLLPSLCEGSATVVYEALNAGLPVICTPNTGSVVRDGTEGFVVPIRNSAAIVESLQRLGQDRGLHRQMSQNASERANGFTLRAYGHRLASAIGER